jgi:hypothetical protein
VVGNFGCITRDHFQQCIKKKKRKERNKEKTPLSKPSLVFTLISLENNNNNKNSAAADCFKISMVETS